MVVPLPGRSVTILSMPPPRQVARSRVLPFGCLPLKMQAAAARRLRRSPIWSCRCQAGAQIPMCRLRSVVHNSAGHNCYPTPLSWRRHVPGVSQVTRTLQVLSGRSGAGASGRVTDVQKSLSGLTTQKWSKMNHPKKQAIWRLVGLDAAGKNPAGCLKDSMLKEVQPMVGNCSYGDVCP